jgi:D-3-phosphoglycerate dehydrogenase
MAEYILITPRSLSGNGHPHLQRIQEAGYELRFPTPGRQPTEEELIEAIQDCVGYLAGVEKISRSVLETAGKLKVISRNGVGVDNIDVETAERLGIAVEKAHGANARGVAELTVALMLAVSRLVPQTHAAIKRGDWNRWKGRELRGKTLGLIGCGNIGQETARIALGLEMKILSFDPDPDLKFNPGSDFAFTSFEDLLKESDVLSLHCPQREKPIIDRRIITTFKENAVLINTARAELIDEMAVYEALEQGLLFGFGTDVFSTEPPEPSALIRHNRVVTTAHIGGFTTESIERATSAAVDNILKYLQ